MLGPGERLAAREPEAVGRASALSNDRRSTDDRVAEVAALLGAHRRLSTKEIIAALGWSRSTTRRVLEAAVADGAVRATAPSPRSPEQSYEPTG
jgi:DNA-binding IclR family transcriptional regulator